jgi:putative phosphoribosyl transferase
MLSGNFAELVHIPADSVTLEGMLVIPPGAQCVVVFAHGSGSSRHSPRKARDGAWMTS